MTAAGRNEAPTHVAVLDIGKTNVKLNAVTSEGAVLETLSTPNPSLDGPPYRHHDLATLESWLMDGLADLGRRHPLGAFVTCGHGSGGVLVDDDGPVAPMIDYEQPIPEHVGRAYADLAGPFEERGSAVMLGATHLARQMLWLETDHAQAFRRARWFLGLPQYWAWRLTGSAASEVTILAAQSNIWNVPGRRFTEIVRARGWERLLPPFVPAWRTVGPLRPGLARRLGLAADLKVLCGIHDSSANFYRYQAAGLGGMTVVSTGTWIVGFSDDCDLSVLSEERGMTCNADIMGNPLAGVLTMAGREFALVAGDSAAGPNADPDELARLVDAGTMALPSFGGEDGLFPGSAGRGRIVGPPPATPQARRALAVLYMALLTDVCLDALCSDRTVILDGSYVRDPLYAALVAAFHPDRRTMFNLDAYGTAAGSALLAGHETRTGPAPIALETPARLALPRLPAYRAEWLELARGTARSTTSTMETNR